MGWCHWWLMLNADANLRFENLRFFGRLFPLGSFHHWHCSYCIKHHKTHACTHFFCCNYLLLFLEHGLLSFLGASIVCCFVSLIFIDCLLFFLLSCLCNLFFPPSCSFSLLFRFLHPGKATSNSQISSNVADWEEKSKKPTLPLGLTSFDDEELQESQEGSRAWRRLGR